MSDPVRSFDIQSLRYLAEFRVLSVRQLAVLENANVRSVRRRLASLDRQGFITKRVRIRNGVRGKPEHIFHVTPRGLKLMQSEGLGDFTFHRQLIPWENKINVEHQLSVNWVLISAQLLERYTELEVRWLSRFSLSTPYGKKQREFSDAFPPIRNGYDNTPFVPDAVFTITDSASSKTLLFFVEVDRDTESLFSHNPNQKTVGKKLLQYRSFLTSQAYKKYEAIFQAQFKGFRLLLVCTSSPRLSALCRLVTGMESADFVWLTTEASLLDHG
ncbi:MAG: replication-relaxation family protein, partial [bacterium]